jgi:hypothetical protein
MTIIKASSTSKSRSYLFLVSGGCYFTIIVSVLIMIFIAIETLPFFTVQNKSNYIEIADLFDKVVIYLRGHCIHMLDKSTQCYKQPFFTLLYKFPDFSRMPTTFTPENLYLILASAPTSNPYVFIPLILSVLLVILCISFSVHAFRKKYRKWIVGVIVSTIFLLMTLCISLAVAHKVYKDILPGYLNKSITVEVNREGVMFSLTGKLSDVGIRFNTERGLTMLETLVALGVILVLLSIRWIFEGKRGAEPEVQSRRIRSMYAL